MNRKILVLAIIIGLFALIGVSTYAIITESFGTNAEKSETGSELLSEVESDQIIESPSEITKDPNEGVDTSVPTPESETTNEPEGDPQAGYDANGDLRENSKYLDDDGDTIANYYDICQGVDDFGSECSTGSTTPTQTATTNQTTSETETTQAADEVDKNGDPVSGSRYLDADGDTIANYYDICPGVDDFSSSCETDAYNK